MLCWLALGVSFAAVIALVSADQLQVAMRRRRPAGRRRLLLPPRRSLPGPTSEQISARGPMLVRIEPRIRLWRRLLAVVETILLAAAVGFSLALALGVTLFAGAFLLRQAVG